jgi:hypothetical protein
MTFRKIQTTNLVSTETAFTDPLIILNKDGTTATDVGFLSRTGNDTYTGLIRDSDTSKYYLIDSIDMTNQATNDISATDSSITKATLVLDTIEVTSLTADSSFVLPKGTEANRPASPVEGQMYFNTETKMFEGYNGTAWKQLIPSEYQET